MRRIPVIVDMKKKDVMILTKKVPSLTSPSPFLIHDVIDLIFSLGSKYNFYVVDTNP